MHAVHKYTDYCKIVLAWVIASISTIVMLWIVGSYNAFIQIALSGATYLLVNFLLLYITKEKFFISVVKREK